MDREEKSKQPITRFVRVVGGEIRWEKKVNISWTQSSVIGKRRSGELVVWKSVNQMKSVNLNFCLRCDAHECLIQQER